MEVCSLSLVWSLKSLKIKKLSVERNTGDSTGKSKNAWRFVGNPGSRKSLKLCLSLMALNLSAWVAEQATTFSLDLHIFLTLELKIIKQHVQREPEIVRELSPKLSRWTGRSPTMFTTRNYQGTVKTTGVQTIPLISTSFCRLKISIGLLIEGDALKKLRGKTPGNAEILRQGSQIHHDMKNYPKI